MTKTTFRKLFEAASDPYGFIEHAKTVTEPEHEAVHNYASGEYYEPVNDHLRRGGRLDNYKDKDVGAVAKHLARVTSNPIKKKLVTYRGAAGGPNDPDKGRPHYRPNPDHPAYNKEGHVSVHRGFTSSDFSADTAAGYTRERHILRIHAPPGTHAHNTEMHVGEAGVGPDKTPEYSFAHTGEVTFRHGTKFRQGKTTKRKIGGETFHVTDMHVIGHED